MSAVTIRSRTAAAALISAALVACIAAPAPAQSTRDSKPNQQGSLKGQQLGDLDQSLLSGLPPSPKPAQQLRPAGPPAGESGQSPASTNSASPQAPDHPLTSLAEQMRAVERRVAARDTSPATQAQQAEIVAQLDALLKQAQQSGSANAAKAGASGTAQAGPGTGDPAPGAVRDSANRSERGAAQAAESFDVKDVLGRVWGHLPDKLREEMQASLSEQFLPKYERVIEEYYRRLAEERPGPPPSPGHSQH